MGEVLLASERGEAMQALERVLAGQGLRTRTVRDGLAVLERLEEEVPDLVIVDAELPGLSGLQLRWLLRDHPSLGSLPFLLLAESRGEEGPPPQACRSEVRLPRPLSPLTVASTALWLLAQRRLPVSA